MKKLINEINNECQMEDYYLVSQLRSYVISYCEDEGIEKDTNEWNDLVNFIWENLSYLKYEHFEDIYDFYTFLEERF